MNASERKDYDSMPIVKKKFSDSNLDLIKSLLADGKIARYFLRNSTTGEDEGISISSVEDFYKYFLDFKVNEDYEFGIEYDGSYTRFSKDGNFFFIINYYEKISINELTDKYLSKKLLNDVSLISFDLGVLFPNYETNQTDDKLADELGVIYYKIGISFGWIKVFALEEIEEAGYTKDVFLNAPIYKTEKLPSGSILMMLVKEPKMEDFDEEYYKAYKDLYEYLLKNRKQ